MVFVNREITPKTITFMNCINKTKIVDNNCRKTNLKCAIDFIACVCYYDCTQL